MTSWSYIVLLAGLVTMIVLLIQELRRENKRHLWLRITAAVIAVAGVVLMGLPLYLTQKINTPVPADTAIKQPVLTGIVACHWPRTLTAGQEWPVQGTYNNTAARPVTLRLAGFDTVLDSVVIPAGQQQVFSLKAIPLHQGRAVYRITVITGTDTLEQQPLPLEVRKQTPLSVLFLASSPDFENRFLADWLVQQGNAVAVRTLVSGNKYITRFANIPQLPLEQLTPALLDNFDLVVADPAAMNKTIRAWLENAGIGLVLKADSTGISQTPLSLWLSGGRKLPALPVDPAATLPSGSTVLPLVQDSLHRAYVTVTIAGAGKLVRSHISNTFSWLLQEQETAYQQYWSAVLNAAARKKSTEEKISFYPEIAHQHQPLEIQLETTMAPFLKAGKVTLYLAQHPWLPYRWSGTWWPEKAGWQSFATAAGVQWNYIFQPGDWKNSATAASRPADLSPQPQTIRERVSPWWFIIPLLLSLTFLWWEKKM
ncbi:hypothetical protein [Chitinophaga sp. HK235]|uniref:hypothetical protein n=1 Tax=Chitinophaga sp. HK235 TaxID=2952571 RepID=UPI001BAAB273|nr:hypothetical protein [Chitinophaga sp. HK235]